MNLQKIKNYLYNAFRRIKRNFSRKEPLTEGQKYIRGKKNSRFGKNKKRSSFGVSENKAFKEPKTRALVGIGPGFIPYAVFVVFTVLFTQILRSSITSVLLTFVIIWSVFTVIYLLVMFGSIDAFVEHNGGAVYKKMPTDFKIKLVNHTFLPAPFLEADIRIPEENALRCVRKRVKVAMYGSGEYEVNRSVSFSYRGTYDVGVDTVTVYDFFKIFRINIRLYNYRSIFVMPRRFTLNRQRRQTVTDSQTEIQKNIFGVERSDVAEIRAYVPGDQMKNIHWKLSSKSEELQVKHFSMNSGKLIYIFCDMKAHYDPEKDSSYDVDINAYGIDGVVELAVALASKEMADGNSCVMLWHDSRAEGGIQVYHCNDNEEFTDVQKMFATAPVYYGEGSVTDLTSLITETQNVSVSFITDSLDAEFVSSVSLTASLISSSGSGGCEVMYFDVSPKIHEPSIADMHRDFALRCKDALIQAGIEFSDGDSNLLSV